MKVCFETFGCRLNRAEALEEEAKYLADGYELTQRHDDADVIVVRGCSVTRRAQHDCDRLVAHLRERYPRTKLVLEGCYRPPEENESPVEVILARARAAKAHAAEKAASASPPPGPPPLPTRTARAYLKVQDGCAGQCSFCIVPQFRGASRSEDFSALVDKAQRFAEAGYREIVVTGCNLSLYASAGRRLPELVAALAQAVRAHGCRIRLGSLEPSAVAFETVDAVAENPNVCRFLHLPVQSGSSTILQAMRRPYLMHDVDRLAHHALSRMHDVALGCDLIAGFPGETPTDHFATLSMLRRIPFSRAHVFPFSSRPGTAAAALPGAVASEVRKARAHELAAAADASRARFAQRFVGREVEVVIEDERHLAGWTGEYLWCSNSVPTLLGRMQKSRYPRKSLVRMRINSLHGSELKGHPV